ncbi:MAG TPA: hypothetical protein VK206_04305 [Anaerolineales bacterium]|nr:hypothetical protein [Anaerolineales bacterium]HLO31798.1 hypothetical protein [Anaerolineales bacterium]
MQENKETPVIDPKTVIQASKRLAEFVEWQNSLLSMPNSKLYRVLKWGDSILVHQAGLTTTTLTTKSPSNFQAVGLWSPEAGWGGVTNFIRISHDEVMNLAAMQLEDEFELKKPGWDKDSNMEKWRSQKMNWLCKDDGTIYMVHDEEKTWTSAPFVRWGTIALGGNLVQVEGFETVQIKLRSESSERRVAMARLKGFRASDWDRPLDDLLSEGLVHRCFCAYRGNKFGDSPKGIVYSPFFSMSDWDFAGKARPTALYIPMEWLEPKAS